jgi:CRISPR-associated protein (TIGR02584 family)
MIDVVLVTELGPNPAALVEALWALPRSRGLRVVEVFLLTAAEGLFFLDVEVLAPGAALDQLRAALGGDALDPSRLHRVAVADAQGKLLEEERTAEDSAAWNEARWRLALAALKAAGERPVVFALAGGRRRTSSALLSAVFQLLARPQDRLLDVRVSDRRVEGAKAGFFFPEQPAQHLVSEEGPVRAGEVQVLLVDVEVPRLRRLLPEPPAASYAEALRAGFRAIERASVVELQVDLAAGQLRISGEVVPVQEARLAWIAALALARKRGLEDGWVEASDGALLREVLDAMQAARGPGWAPAARPLQRILGGDDPADMDAAERRHLNTIRDEARAALRRFAGDRDDLTRHVVPVGKKSATGAGNAKRWRLPLDPAWITLLGLLPPSGASP